MADGHWIWCPVRRVRTEIINLALADHELTPSCTMLGGRGFPRRRTRRRFKGFSATFDFVTTLSALVQLRVSPDRIQLFRGIEHCPWTHGRRAVSKLFEIGGRERPMWRIPFLILLLLLLGQVPFEPWLAIKSFVLALLSSAGA